MFLSICSYPKIAFEVIGVISVLTNCALIGMDPEVQKLLPSDITAINMVLIFVGVEVKNLLSNFLDQNLRKDNLLTSMSKLTIMTL